MTSKVWLWVEGGLAVKDFMPLPHNRHDGLMCSVSVWKNQHCEKKKKVNLFFFGTFTSWKDFEPQHANT